jgi:hypothetical protein
MTLSIRVSEGSPGRGCASGTALECLANYSYVPCVSLYSLGFMCNAHVAEISTSLAMAHMNAQSSRAMAVMIN